MTELGKKGNTTAVVLQSLVTEIVGLTKEVGRLANEVAQVNHTTQQLCVWRGAVDERHRIEDEKPKAEPVGVPAMLTLVLTWMFRFLLAGAALAAGINLASLASLVK